jgi:hypothetical protein
MSATSPAMPVASSVPPPTEPKIDTVRIDTITASDVQGISVPFVKEHSRKWIAYLVVGAYVALLALNVILPFALYWLIKPANATMSIADIKDLTQSISSVLAGLVGIVGFVMGYYFKSAEEEKKAHP